MSSSTPAGLHKLLICECAQLRKILKSLKKSDFFENFMSYHPTLIIAQHGAHEDGGCLLDADVPGAPGEEVRRG